LDNSDLVDALRRNVHDGHGLRPRLDERYELGASSLADGLRVTNILGRISDGGRDAHSTDGYRTSERTSAHFVYRNEDCAIVGPSKQGPLQIQRGCGCRHG
jgi:hypothetical protein